MTALLHRSAAPAVAVLVLAACNGSSSPAPVAPSSVGPHVVSAAQADRLAVSRFLLYQGTGARAEATLTGSQSNQRGVRLVADIDYRTGTGYGLITGAGSGFVVEWDAWTFLAWPGSSAGLAPAALPTTRPAARALDPTRTTTDAVLSLLLRLGSTRPDNAQLLRQGGARWLRSATVSGTRVDVIAGPRRSGGTESGADGAAAGDVTYYVDARGNLLRVDASLGGGSSILRLTLVPSAFRTVPRSAALAR